MAEIIDLTTKETLSTTTDSSPRDLIDSQGLIDLIDIIKLYQQIEGFILYIKEPNGDIAMYRNNSITIKDRSYILQLLQSDIQDELAPTIDTDLEDDL